MKDDKFLWKHDTDDYKEYFSSARTWEQIRCKKEAVNWSDGCGLNKGFLDVLSSLGLQYRTGSQLEIERGSGGLRKDAFSVGTGMKLVTTYSSHVPILIQFGTELQAGS